MQLIHLDAQVGQVTSAGRLTRVLASPAVIEMTFEREGDLLAQALLVRAELTRRTFDRTYWLFQRQWTCPHL